MLRYLALGERNFGLHPMTLARRVDWEFYVILKGKAAPVFDTGENPPPQGRVMWVFHPEHRHGWAAERRGRCRIAAFQFAMLPDALRTLIGPRGAMAVSLTANEARAIEAWAQELQPHFSEPNAFSELVAQRVLLQLSLIALNRHQAARIRPAHRTAQFKVTQALEWFEQHMHEQPSLKLVADAVHLSPSYLRRLFWAVRKQRPKTALRTMQLDRVIRRLTTSSATLDVVASECGFASASELCRVFKAHFKVPPATWQRNALPLYREPRATRGRAALGRPDTEVHRRLSKYIRFE